MSDARRRRWIRISVDFAVGRTGQALVEKFGAAGLGVWIAYLVACKTSPVQGTFTYFSEVDGWTQLGLYRNRPKFTLEDFFTFTGRLKQTRRTRRGRETNVKCTQWGRWQDVKKLPANEPLLLPENVPITPLARAESERESEKEKKTKGERSSSFVNPDSALTANLASILVEVPKPGYSPDVVTEERLARVVAAYPDRDHVAEALALVDWETAGNGAELKTKDGVQRLRNWLRNAEPRRNGDEPVYPKLQPGERIEG